MFYRKRRVGQVVVFVGSLVLSSSLASVKFISSSRRYSIEFKLENGFSFVYSYELHPDLNDRVGVRGLNKI